MPPSAADVPEICICAAIRCRRELRVIRGHRHHDCMRTADEMHVDPRRAVQGFVTSRGRFVTRTEGLALQRAAGILSIDEHGYRGDLLFSEDLY